ncbi:E3 ubiquitin-protein ligase HACE1-like isoform X2 [Dysidea avara]|uniref:E3 ubiquitin-protein ligase HACE1-like isoform X2 n=1 Tax=Dysidea avara TaxID=196820 RepID=UPI00331EAD5E
MDVVQRMRKALRRGRSVELPPDNREAAFVLLPYCLQNQHRVIADLLNGSNYDVNYCGSRDQRTLLHHCARHKKCVQKLLEAGADIRLHDYDGQTALHWLAYNGRTELMVTLLHRGEFVDVEDVHGQTALHVSCRNGHGQTAVELLERNADINKPDRQGRRALNFACQNGQVDCIKMLIRRGSKCEADHSGISPIEQCVMNSYQECAELILRQFPTELDCLINLSCGQKISEDIIIMTLQHLCANDQLLHSTILSRLAKQASTTGLELLSSSSDYDNWSTQFLRMVRILCALDQVPVTPVSPREQHRPTSPRRRRWNSFLSSGTRDTAIVAPSASTESQPPRRHSFDELSTDFELAGKESPKPGDISSSPFFLLEAVWNSLYSWYDLLEVEVQRLPEAGSNTAATAGTNHQVPDLSVKDVSTEPPQDVTPTAPPGPLRSLSVESSEGSSDIAAAIIQGAPVSRRTAFLRGTPQRAFSLEELPVPKDSRKRHSLNLENANIAVSPGTEQISLQSSGGGADLQQTGGRTLVGDQQLSCNSPIEEGNEDGHELTPPMDHVDMSTPTLEAATASINMTTTSLDMALPSLDAASSTNASESSELLLTSRGDFVSDFADRLCAITHGYALCCKALHRKSETTLEVYPPFEDFIDKYEKVLRVLLARNPLLIFEHFHFLLEYPSLLKRFMHIVREQPFDLRKKWFYDNLYKDKRPSNEINMFQDAQVMMVDRGNIFSSSCSKIMEADPNNLKENLPVRFLGEAGVGTGVLREWFDQLSAEVLNPNYALFIQSADGATFQPNSNSDINPDHLSYFNFSGRMMALAIYHQHLLSVYFTRSFYKHILGIPVSYRDVESIDPEFAKNLQWTLDHEIDDLDLDLTFAVETDVFGAATEMELLEGGKSITVSDNNKFQYVQLVAEMKLTAAIQAQIQHFLEGFYGIIPHSLIALFNEYELELLMSGLPEIDPDDWEANAEYSGGDGGYTEDHPVIKWFWELVHEYSQKDRALLLQFVTGSSRVPMGGFTNLVGASGQQKFTITREQNPDRLPTASTCFNLLKLPEYRSKQMIADRLSVAIHCGSQGFEFA